MTVYQFDHNNKELLNRFINFQYMLYASDRQCVLPFRSTVTRELNQDINPFFSYGSGTYFLAEDKGETTGRVAAFRNPGMDHGTERIGTVGYFESIMDYSVAEHLLDYAFHWLASCGCTSILGPMNYSIWNKYRFKTDQLNERSTFAEPYNKPYYPEYFLRYGFRGIRRWYSTEIDLQNKEYYELLKKRWEGKYKKRYDRIRELGFSVEPNNPSQNDKEFKDIYRISTAAFSSHLYFYPVTLSEFDFLFGSIRRLVKKGQIIFSHRHGECQGFGVHTFDYTGSLASMKGKTSFPAKLKFLSRVRKDTIINVFSAITPENIENRSGLASGMFYICVRSLYLNGKTRYVIHPLMHEQNRSRLYSMGISRLIGTYELYKKRI